MARDLLNIIGIGAIPPFSWLLDLPLLVMHFNYAGSKAAFTLLELIPVVGVFPFFTVAALNYPDHDASPPPPPPPPPDRLPAAAPAFPPPAGLLPGLPSPEGVAPTVVYALVDGKLVPVLVPAEHGKGALPHHAAQTARPATGVRVTDAHGEPE